MKASKINSQDTKWVFLKKGTCSRTLFYILNREYGHPMENEERAADPLAGGILQHGYQCGLLFGSVMAAGAEAYRREGKNGREVSLAIKASQIIMEAFKNKANSTDCLDITDTDFSKKLDFAKYMISGKFLSCFKLADKWAPEAIKVAEEGLSGQNPELPERALSCTSELIRRMGGTDEEMAIVAGLAGGLGLSGNACGVLSAAIWMKSLGKVKETGKSQYPDPELTEVLEAFMEETDYEFGCDKISGRCFKTIGEHSDFIEDGGCAKLIDVLAQSAS